MIRKLTPFECHAGGPDHLRALAFFDLLVGLKLLAFSHLPEGGGYPACTGLDFEQGAELSTRFDDEGNPGGCEWDVVDAEGYLYRPVQIHDLVGQTVTAVGYFLDPENDVRPAIPYVEIAGIFNVCPFCQEGGAVICHYRDPDQCDLFCELKPKPRKEPSNASNNQRQ